MNRHAPLTKRRKDQLTTMTNADTTAPQQTAAVAEQGAHVAPEKTTLKKSASRKKAAAKGQKSAKGGKPKAAAPKKTVPAKKAAQAPKKTAKSKTEGARQGSKTAMILDLLQRAKGATLAEIMKATSLAGPQRPRVHQRHPGEETGLDRNLLQRQGWGSQLLGQGLRRCQSIPPLAAGVPPWRLFLVWSALHADSSLRSWAISPKVRPSPPSVALRTPCRQRQLTRSPRC